MSRTLPAIGTERPRVGEPWNPYVCVEYMTYVRKDQQRIQIPVWETPCKQCRNPFTFAVWNPHQQRCPACVPPGQGPGRPIIHGRQSKKAQQKQEESQAQAMGYEMTPAARLGSQKQTQTPTKRGFFSK